jgi:glycerol-3-phosphate dehydrogenase (NAD(P)+)
MRTTVLGGGAWGTALASHAARAGLPVRMWIREPEVVAAVNETRGNPAYLPGVELPEGIRATSRLDEALADAEAVLVVVPSEFCRAVYRQAHGLAPEGAVFVSATKGLEIDTLQRMSEVAAAEAPSRPLAVLSGPSFALEVAKGLPTAVVVAAADHAVAEKVQRPLATRAFRVYSSQDVVGVELAGALKNVIAIAAGIIDGLGYGHNTEAALITRGLAEIARLAVALGARPDTLAGLAGLGDLVLTCTGNLSRNYSVGFKIGQGAALKDVLAEMKMVAEGVKNAESVYRLSQRENVEMPITEQVYLLVHAGKSPKLVIQGLMGRKLKNEFWK